METARLCTRARANRQTRVLFGLDRRVRFGRHLRARLFASAQRSKNGNDEELRSLSRLQARPLVGCHRVRRRSLASFQGFQAPGRRLRPLQDGLHVPLWRHIARRGQSSRKKHRPAIRAGLPPCHREGPRLPGALIGRGRKMLSLFPTRRVKLYTARRETKIRNLYFSRFRRGDPCIDARSRAARPPRFPREKSFR